MQQKTKGEVGFVRNLYNMECDKLRKAIDKERAKLAKLLEIDDPRRVIPTTPLILSLEMKLNKAEKMMTLLS